MRFEQLPDDWSRRPLDDAPLAAGVIDLVIGYEDRQRDTLLILPCDEYDAALPSPILIGDTDWTASSRDRRRSMAVLSQVPVPGFVVGLSAGRRLPAKVVRGWLRTIEDELDSSGQALLAFGVADPHGVEIVGGRAARNGSLGAAAG
ncbi:hypothetical protein [Dietzia sp. B32]|uniref:hypothetical protein n=1 Tax=Dietzia sp. B32 TaxID=2915130 RepID=UPI0021AE1316|nr:hypothetical protein [Dietzia sp. B32]UVE95841.1 hypothetical protein L8M95_03315 [Dietzia sp. B32]